MQILKFSLLFIVLSVLLVGFGQYVGSIFDSVSASINYITTGNIEIVINEIVGFVGWGLDLLFLDTTTVYTTSIGNIEVYSLAWLFTFVRVVFGLVAVGVILKLIIDKD